MNSNAIILRDIPKDEARLDLFTLPLSGGFRGFRADAPIIGWHYVSVKAAQTQVGFWCHLAPGEAVVRIFDPARGLVEDEPAAAAHYAQLALAGAMDQALAPYPLDRCAAWFGLVAHIPAENFPPEIHAEDSGAGSRWDQALHGTHAGDAAAFLAEFQYAFVRWLVSQGTGAEDAPAFARWRHLVQAAYNAGERRITAAADLFVSLVDALMRQFDCLPAEWFQAGSFVVEHAHYLADDLRDSGVDRLAESGQAFAEYMERRQAGS